jgi:hypothetical protein
VAEHSARRQDPPVTIFTRTPGVESLTPDTVRAGGEEFERKFIVECRVAGAAVAARKS